MEKNLFTIGEIASQSGVTIRALRHYDRIGLLCPMQRSRGGYRLYGQADISRLYLIASLQHIGCSLADIKTMLNEQKMSLSQLLPMQIEQIERQLERQKGVLNNLRSLQQRLDQRPDLDHADSIHLLTMLHTMNQYFTYEQMQKMNERGKKLGMDHIKAVEAEWPVLIAEVKKHMAAATDPADPAVQKLAKRWMELVHEFTGGDKGIEQSLGKMYREQQTNLQASFGNGVPTPEMFGYIQNALKHAA